MRGRVLRRRAPLLALLAAVSCGGGELHNSDGGAPDAGDARAQTGDGAADGGGGGDARACPTQAPPGGDFVFHVRNTGSETRVIQMGCGRNLPITFQVAGATLGAGAESADFCGFTCDPVLAGDHGPTGCTDCGGGLTVTLAAGASADLTWDRRVWARTTVSAACSGLASEAMCALGVAVPASQPTEAVLTYCAQVPPTLACPTASVRTLPIQVDLGLNAADVALP